MYPLGNHLSQHSRVIFGCMGLGGSWDQNPISGKDINVANTAIDAALESGIKIFDHADIYTFGKAEQVFGQVLKQRPELRQQISLQSKCAIRFADDKGPKRYDFSADYIRQSVDGILSRLNIEQLDVLMLHRPDPLMDSHEVAEVFAELNQAGKVNHFGVSNMSVGQMKLLNNALAEKQQNALVCNQIELSLSHLGWLEQDVCQNDGGYSAQNISPELLPYCQLNNIQIQAWGSLSQGLFSGKNVSQEPEHIQRTAELVAKLAGDYQVSAEAIVLAFVNTHPANIQPVIGTTNPERIRACGQANELLLSREHWYQLYVTARGNELP